MSYGIFSDGKASRNRVHILESGMNKVYILESGLYGMENCIIWPEMR